MTIGSTTHSDIYRSELQKAIDDVDYEIISLGPKKINEERNESCEYITKEQIQKTINKKGNDIDLVLT
jgi:hypothetical protein